MRPCLIKTAALVAVFLCVTSQTRDAAATDHLTILKDGLHWPHVSSLIGYRDRLWFVNSRKYVNHNSADIWSYDPASGKARYERHLLSQDAGDPVIHKGLLYWPFEDSRFSPGRGEFAVTNGKAWRWGLLPEGRAFHVHAMTSSGGKLFAAPSAWVARLQSSDNGGTDWKLIYEHPTPDRRVSRITALENFRGTLYGGLVAWYPSKGAKLLRWDGNTFAQMRGWPEGSAVPRLQAFGGWLYGVNIANDASSLWRTDGKAVEAIKTFAGKSVRGMAAGPGALWVATGRNGVGELWRSRDGRSWSLFQTFPGVTLHGIGIYQGQVYAGGSNAAGGVLLGPRMTATAGLSRLKTLIVPKDLPRARPLPKEDTAAYLATLKTALADPQGYDRRLRIRFAPLALSDDPAIGQALGKMLDGPFPEADATMFGSRRFPAPKMARWYILWAMAHNGHGRVPPALIAAPWEAPQNGAEKYFESAPAAAWAAAELGQKDDETLSALIARLDRAGDPDWLKGDIIGALTVLTGQRFAYDISAWQRWWTEKSSR
jgi:hypothetical protein